MACIIEMRCLNKDCETDLFDYDKGSIMNDTPEGIKCPTCGSKKTHRVYGVLATEVCEGLLGNAKNSYNKGVINHRSNLAGNLKGKRVR